MLSLGKKSNFVNYILHFQKRKQQPANLYNFHKTGVYPYVFKGDEIKMQSNCLLMYTKRATRNLQFESSSDAGFCQHNLQFESNRFHHPNLNFNKKMFYQNFVMKLLDQQLKENQCHKCIKCKYLSHNYVLLTNSIHAKKTTESSNI